MNIFESEAESFEMWMSDIWLNHSDNPELCRQKMEDLMCETLEKFGCYSGIEIFRKVLDKCAKKEG